jgi:hypothetical protein
MDSNEIKKSCDELIADFKKQSSENCDRKGQCIKYVQLYLDNMACRNRDASFLKGVLDCEVCCNYFQLNDCIKKNLKNKVIDLEIGDDFVQKVKDRMFQENYYTKK